MSEEAQIRCFFAITPPAEILDSVATEVAEFRKLLRDCDVSWERREKWHVTLQFVGPVKRGDLSALVTQAALATKDIAMFEATARGTGAFPDRDRPRVLWAGVSDSDDHLMSTHRHLHEAAQVVLARDLYARFHPHLTFCRVRGRPHSVSRLFRAQPESDHKSFGSWRVTHVELWQSNVSANGSTYELIAEFPLRA